MSQSTRSLYTQACYYDIGVKAIFTREEVRRLALDEDTLVYEKSAGSHSLPERVPWKAGKWPEMAPGRKKSPETPEFPQKDAGFEFFSQGISRKHH